MAGLESLNQVKISIVKLFPCCAYGWSALFLKKIIKEGDFWPFYQSDGETWSDQLKYNDNEYDTKTKNNTNINIINRSTYSFFSENIYLPGKYGRCLSKNDASTIFKTIQNWFNFEQHAHVATLLQFSTSNLLKIDIFLQSLASAGK